MISLFKFVHIATIAIWSAGLISLPFLYLQRPRLGDDGLALDRLHKFVRYFYVGLISPAAFVAIATGTVLIFLRQPYEPWFTVKLALVGGLVLLHVLSGLMILRLFEPDGRYKASNFVIVTVLNVSAVTAILVVVLGKPDLFREPWLAEFFRPGALGEMVKPWLGPFASLVG